MSQRVDAVVIGAGISGLSAAYYLREQGLDAIVVERDARPGGVIETSRHEGFLCEYGPNSALDSSGALSRLVASLGIESRVAPVAASAKKRFVLKNGGLCLLPMSPPAMITSKLFSARGKLQLFSEPFKPKKKPDAEESLAAFVKRRFGPEALDYGADPFVSGVYAGDPNEIGVRSAFPVIAKFEDEAGSVIKGAIRAAKERRKSGAARAEMVSFDDGMQVLTDALRERLGDRIRFDCDVVSIERDASGWRVVTTDNREPVQSSAVVLSLPAARTAKLIAPLDVAASEVVGSIPYAGIAVVHLGYPVASVGHDLEGFGLLVPSKEKRDILGILFSSTLFPKRAPEGTALLTVMMGGARGARLLDASDDELVTIATRETADILGAAGEPTFTHVRRRARAIPQYTTRHHRVIDAVNRVETAHPGLYFATNYAGGVSVPDCIATSERVAGRIIDVAAAPQPVSS